MNLPKVSLVIPCYNEEAFIKRVLLDIEKQLYPKEQIEVFVVDGRSTDNTRSEFEAAQTEVNYSCRLLDNPERIAPVAMNRGIQAATGSYIFIWGAHASYPPDFIKNMIQLALKSNAACVGAVCITEAREKTAKGRAIAEVLQHPLGVGNASFRTGTNSIQEVDTVAFGCYKKETFEQFGLFNPSLIRNQDIELNKRIVNNGGKILLDPGTNCTYFARSKFGGLWKNNFGNGEWVVKTAKITGKFEALSLRHFVPMIFVIGLVTCLTLLLGNQTNRLFPRSINGVFLAPIILYTLAITTVSARIALKNRSLKIFLNAIFSFFILHISYGFGSLKGLLTSKKI